MSISRVSIVKLYALLIAGSLLAPALIGSTSQIAAQSVPAIRRLADQRPSSVLFIGNSFFYYNNGLQSHVGRLAAAADTTYRMRNVLIAISGSGFDWHDVDSYFRPDAIGSYSFNAKNEIVFAPNASRLFDVAIMIDCSQCPVHPRLKENFRKFGKEHIEAVRRHGAQPVLFMSWAYADRPEMTEQLADAYTWAGNEYHALVIPAGLAFARSVQQRPALNLYADDLRHPSMAGTYLAACTVYASLIGKSPIGISYTAGLEPETARFLQSVAWETVNTYFKW